MNNYILARTNMVKGQIAPNKIVDSKLLEVLGEMPRHLFVPESLKNIAYSDEILAINDNRYIMPPMVFARMLQIADVKSDDTALVVACGGGYSSAVLAKICKKVTSLDSDPEMATKANYMIKKLDIGNAIILNEKLSEGHKDGAPYDVIFINGAIDKIPHQLLEQLAEGGRLVTAINEGICGRVFLFTKTDGVIAKEEVFDANLPTIADF